MELSVSKLPGQIGLIHHKRTLMLCQTSHFIFQILNIFIQGTNSISVLFYNLDLFKLKYIKLFTNKLDEIHTSEDKKLSTYKVTDFHPQIVSTFI